MNAVTTQATSQPVTLIGESASMVTLREEIDSAARTQAKVLILGETGVGKEVVARLIHEGSARQHRQFVPVNCSGIPETLLESELFGHMRGSFTGAYRDKPGLVRLADRGTLFLDELGEMSLRMQAVLLRFTETGEVQPVGADTPAGRVDARLITATHRDLRGCVDTHEFREDLYYRLNVIQIRIPPLRERGEDVRLLLMHYLRVASEVHATACPVLSAGAEELLLAYRWPGNVRELRNLAERLVVRGISGAVRREDLPSEFMAEPSTPTATVGRALAARESPSANVAPGRTSPVANVDRLWERIAAGETFWTAVHQPFKAHDLTRHDLRELIHRGLLETRGNYRGLLRLFHMESADYKRFLAFLYQCDCSLPVRSYRDRTATSPGERSAEASYTPDHLADLVADLAGTSGIGSSGSAENTRDR